MKNVHIPFLGLGTFGSGWQRQTLLGDSPSQETGLGLMKERKGFSRRWSPLLEAFCADGSV